jgi:hypothetical protein
MAALKMPLLCHTGPERSFLHSDDSLADPNRLRLPLELGVTVIAAHAGGTGKVDGIAAADSIVKLMQEFPNLYADNSALTLINKPGCLKRAVQNPILRDRLIYGSDAPLINTALTSPWYYPTRLTIRQMLALHRISNPWQRDIALKQALGVPTEVFERSSTVLRLPPANGRGG